MYERRHSYTRNSQLQEIPRRHNFQCIRMYASAYTLTGGIAIAVDTIRSLSSDRLYAVCVWVGVTHQLIRHYEEGKNQKKGLVCVARSFFFVLFGRRIPRVTSHFITYTIYSLPARERARTTCRVIL